MIRKKAYVNNRGLFALVVMLGLITMISCSEKSDMTNNQAVSNYLDKELAQAVSQGSNRKISLANLSIIEWDKLYIYGPYTTNDDIASDIGGVNTQIIDASIEDRDDICLLIFTYKSNIKLSLVYPRKNFDFSTISTKNPVQREAAVFRLVESSNENGRYYLDAD